MNFNGILGFGWPFEALSRLVLVVGSFITLGELLRQLKLKCTRLASDLGERFWAGKRHLELPPRHFGGRLSWKSFGKGPKKRSLAWFQWSEILLRPCWALGTNPRRRPPTASS